MKEWTVDQVAVYSDAFREGDAVYTKDFGWEEYHNDFGDIYEVVTPKDYEVKEGDKLVRLGNTIKQGKHSEFTFGRVYEVYRSREGGSLVYQNDMAITLLASYLKEHSGLWGVIPKWENVKKEKTMNNSLKFSVGDKVRVVKGDTLLPNEKVFIGDVGEIAKVDISGEDQYPYAVDIPEVGRYLWVEEDALEIARESTSTDQSIEHLALDYLLSQGSSPIKVALTDELVEWANSHLMNWNFTEVRKILDIAERLIDEDSKEK